MENKAWWEIALMIMGAGAALLPLVMWLLNKGRRQSAATISKTEGEVYKNIIENKLAELNINEVIEKKVEMEIAKFKDMLWDAQEEHFTVKLEMQKRLEKELKEKTILHQENEMLRTEHASCQQQIDELKKEVDKLKKKL